MPKLALNLTLALVLALPVYGGAPVKFAEFFDAGDPYSAKITADASDWSADLIEIRGNLDGSDRVDSYCIIISDSANFLATTSAADATGASASFDTRLFLFDTLGGAFMANDDTPSGGLQSTLTHPASFSGAVVDLPGAPADGERYILSISGYPFDALKDDGQPVFDLASNFTSLVGPGSGALYDHMSNGSLNGGLYSIVLQGAQVCGYNLAFVTTETGSGNLSTWTNANGSAGVVAGDEVCQAAAASANLPNPNTFVAWLSDSNNDAFCRAFGLPGKVANNCDLLTLSDINGAYQRTDGPMLGRSLTEIVDGEILRPINHDENGDAVTLSTVVYTGTSSSGELASNGSCSSWTTTADSAAAGETTTATHGWTEISAPSCNANRPIYCLQNGRAPFAPLLGPPAGARLAFLTSTAGSGDISTWPESGGVGGLAGADAVCQFLAETANLPNRSVFKAWLSTSTIDARDRFQSDGPWYRTDGPLFAQNLNHLSQSLLDTSLIVDEDRAPFSGSTQPFAFTGTENAGIASPNTCSNWTSDSAGDNGLSGFAYFANDNWMDFAPLNCQTPRHLYCFADSTDNVFADGFESGNTSAWSNGRR